MSLKNTIDNQIKESMLNKSKERLVALRAIKSAILLEEKNGGSKKTEDVQILMRLIKQRKDSSQLYKEQNRIDLSEKEESEIKIIQEFLPKQINDEELDNEIDKIINDLNASSIKDTSTDRVDVAGFGAILFIPAGSPKIIFPTNSSKHVSSKLNEPFVFEITILVSLISLSVKIISVNCLSATHAINCRFTVC